MKCSACSNGTLKSDYLMMGDYLRWQDSNPSIDLNTEPPVAVEVEETSKAMICPKTGGLMTKYRISKDTNHRVDLSPTINAIWLDNGEWGLLKNVGLAGRLNNIFTDHWQHEIRAQESAEVLESLHRRKFGDNYDKVVAFRDVLDGMDNRSEVIAFLLSDDPYRV